MAQLGYKVISTTADESQNLVNSILYISQMNDSNWVAQNPKSEEIVSIKFDTPSQVKQIDIKTIFCSGIVVSLYNLSQDNIKIQVKQLEKQNFLSNNHKARIFHQDSTDNYYEYADITFKSMNQQLSIGYILFFGIITSQQQNKQINIIGSKQYERPIPLFPLNKSGNSESKLMIEPVNSAVKTQFNPSISQRSTQIVNKAKLQASQTNLFPKSENKPIQINKIKYEDSEVKKAMEESLKTYKQETEKQSKNIIEEELLEQIDSFYEDEKLSNYLNKAEEQNKTIDTELNNLLQGAKIQQKRYSQQKEQVKQTLFTQNKIQQEKIILTKTKAPEDLELEQMTQYNEKMIDQEFVQYHTILEDSFFRGTKLFDQMNKSFKPLAGHIIYIKPDGITEFEYRRLELKAKNLGATVEKQITDQTSIIISDIPLFFVDKNANILVLNQKFLESCPSDNFLKVDKYIIK